MQGLYRKHNKASDATVSVLPLRNEDEESVLGAQSSPDGKGKSRAETRRMSKDHPLAGRTKADRVSPPVSPKTKTAGEGLPPSIEAIPVAATAASTSTSATFAPSVSSSVALEAVTVETPRDETARDLEQRVLASAPTPADQV